MATTSRHYLKLASTSRTFAQLIRYGIAGVATVMIYSSIYLTLVWLVFPGERAVMAVPFAFVITLIAGFYLHSRWSFAGHGTRDNSGHQHGKFLIVHSAGFGVNLAFTWVLTAYFSAPTWVPLIPAATVTPIVSFLLQRRWVFA